MSTQVNPDAVIVCQHSARGTQSIEVKWSTLGFRYLGVKNPELPRILNDLATTGRSSYKDDSGLLTMRTKDAMFLQNATDVSS